MAQQSENPLLTRDSEMAHHSQYSHEARTCLLFSSAPFKNRRESTKNSLFVTIVDKADNAELPAESWDTTLD